MTEALLSGVLETAVEPAIALLPPHMASDKLRVMMLAIGLQESRLLHRAQIVYTGAKTTGTDGRARREKIKGPARGLWQFERGTKASQGGVWGVYLHRASNDLLRLLCRSRDVNFDPLPIWASLENDDILAAGVARLLLWTDAKPLPAIGDSAGAWAYYLRCWRPGKPHPSTWPKLYAQAVAAIDPS